MNHSLLILTIFWGVWIIIPVLFDGILTLVYMHTIIFYQFFYEIPFKKRKMMSIEQQDLPKVSIIIPTWNEEDNINECLNYLKIQTYPHEKMEIIVVDNGSTDATAEIVKRHMHELWQQKHGGIFDNSGGKIKINGRSYGTGGFNGDLRLVVRQEKGKAKALNTGIKLAGGDIIVNIDCRSFLAPEAIYEIVAKFIENPEYGAATGNVEIDWQLIYQRDLEGHYLFDKDCSYVARELTRKEIFLGKSQFMEYLVSFRLGRQFQDITGSMYTFSGAFSAFRREIILNSALYKSRTVAEDTDLTLDLQGQNVRLGFAEKAKAYLKPVISFEKFYAQRIRWRRGQIEVIGLHLDWYGNYKKGFWRSFWLNIILMIDHTFGFPRIIWMFMLPLFFLFGYSMTLILEAIVILYFFYVLVDVFNALNCYRVSDQETREKIRESFQYCAVTPFFRIITFFFRFSGYLDALKEPQTWSTPINPVRSVKGYRAGLQSGYAKTMHMGSKVWHFITRQKESSPYFDEKIPEIDTYGLEVGEKRRGPIADDFNFPKKELR